MLRRLLLHKSPRTAAATTAAGAWPPAIAAVFASPGAATTATPGAAAATTTAAERVLAPIARRIGHQPAVVVAASARGGTSRCCCSFGPYDFLPRTTGGTPPKSFLPGSLGLRLHAARPLSAIFWIGGGCRCFASSPDDRLAPPLSGRRRLRLIDRAALIPSSNINGSSSDIIVSCGTHGGGRLGREAAQLGGFEVPSLPRSRRHAVQRKPLLPVEPRNLRQPVRCNKH